MTAPLARTAAEQILAPLNEQQRAAAQVPSGPVVIHAGAGTGKTRVLSHRAAHAAAIGAMDPSRALFLTFTDKAATEMAQRIASLGVPGVTAMTFHKAAWRQLRYFWPQLHGDELAILSQPWRVAAPLVRRLPGHYRFTPTQDVLDMISWVKTRRVPLADVAAAAESAGRAMPVPDDLFARVFTGYERACRQQHQVDFDDMILRTIDVLGGNEAMLAQVRDRYAWFSVDEFQDTNAIQFELLRLWVGDRDDVCVVGDEHQTIYTFAGATSEYLRRFERWYPQARSFALTINYRSTPQVLQLANRLLRAPEGLRATAAPGPVPAIREFDDEADELDGIVAAVRAWLADGVASSQIAVLVRLNADIPPLEHAFTRAGIPFRVTGTRFFERRDVKTAIDLLGRSELAGDGWPDRFGELLTERLGYDPDEEPETAQARERQAAFATLLALVGDLAQSRDRAEVVAALRERAAEERRTSRDGVELITLHRAKGLEWDAVVLLGLEDGHLPVQQALKSPALVEEERRLLYVGITRARRHLLLSWARDHPGPGGRAVTKKASRFLREVAGRPTAVGADRTRRAGTAGGAQSRGKTGSGAARGSSASGGGDLTEDDASRYEELKAWRLERARSDGVPAYVVFPNSTLALIAREQPADPGALAQISGVGPARLEAYGAEVLAVLSRH